MKMLRNILGLLILTAGLGAWADTSTAGQITVTLAPASPVVILPNFDYNYTDPVTQKMNSITVQGPWAQTLLTITNSSDTEITIVDIDLSIDDSPWHSSFTPSNLVPPVTPTPLFLADIPAGKTAQLPTVWLQGLPPTQADPNGSIVNNVIAVLQGWTGSPTAPVDRFTKTVNFVTQ